MRPPRNFITAVAHFHVHDLMCALREATINHEAFDSGPWSLWDAECLERAAALIRRDIAEREAKKGGRP
jgi:hypothetical protein